MCGQLITAKLSLTRIEVTSSHLTRRVFGWEGRGMFVSNFVRCANQIFLGKIISQHITLHRKIIFHPEWQCQCAYLTQSFKKFKCVIKAIFANMDPDPAMGSVPAEPCNQAEPSAHGSDCRIRASRNFKWVLKCPCDLGNQSNEKDD